jgi:hypothetical protein
LSTFRFEAKQSEAKFKSIFSLFSLFFTFFRYFSRYFSLCSCTGSGGGGKKDVKMKSKTFSEILMKIEPENPVDKERNRRKQQPEMHKLRL